MSSIVILSGRSDIVRMPASFTDYFTCGFNGSQRKIMITIIPKSLRATFHVVLFTIERGPLS